MEELGYKLATMSAVILPAVDHGDTGALTEGVRGRALSKQYVKWYYLPCHRGTGNLGFGKEMDANIAHNYPL